MVELVFALPSPESRGGVVLASDRSTSCKNDGLSWREGGERKGWIIFTLINLVQQLTSPLEICVLSAQMEIQTRAAAKCCSVFIIKQDGLGISWDCWPSPGFSWTGVSRSC